MRAAIYARLSSDLQRLTAIDDQIAVARGFRKGRTPHRPAIARMHTLTPILLDAFGGRE